MNKNWSNTALVAYSLLPKIAKELDRAVNSRINLSFQSRHLSMGISTEQLIGEINDLIDEKRKIINLRYIVDKALEGLNEEDRKILRMRISDKLTFGEIASRLDVSIRTVFRKMSQAETAFERSLNRIGMGEAFLENEYGSDKYIYPIYKRLKEEKTCVTQNL